MSKKRKAPAPAPPAPQAAEPAANLPRPRRTVTPAQQQLMDEVVELMHTEGLSCKKAIHKIAERRFAAKQLAAKQAQRPPA